MGRPSKANTALAFIAPLLISQSVFSIECTSKEKTLLDVTLDGYRYTYKNCEALPDITTGFIETYSASTQQLVGKISSTPPTPCNSRKSPPYSELTFPNERYNRRIVVICGHDEGASNTLFFFSDGDLFAQIHHGRSPPSINFNKKDNMYLFPVYKEILNQEGSLTHLLYIYTLTSSTREPIAINVVDYNDLQRNHYLFLKRTSTPENIKYNIQAMLAALSTQNTKFICQEINSKPLTEVGAKVIEEASELNTYHGFKKISRLDCTKQHQNAATKF